MSSAYTADYLRRTAAIGLLAATFGLLAAAAHAGAESAPTAASIGSVVDGLVADALAANLELAASGAGVEARRAALDAARARYLPALDFAARYSRADGGRTIDLPVGDLLNPVYATLNQLTGSNAFNPVQNQRISLLRPREQETKVTLAQPLYDARIGAARDAASAQFDAARAAQDALAGRVTRDMRQAYFRWLQARAQVGILDATLELARENSRVNDSLFRNGKITRDLVYRAEADVLELEQSRLAAANAQAIAQSYVNLLRNAPFDRALSVVAVSDDDVAELRPHLAGHATTVAAVGRPDEAARALEELASVAGAQRAELRALDAELAAAAAGERLARAAFKPQLLFAVDAGTQGEQYRFGSDDRYVLASLVLKFNLFSGGADRAGLAGARAMQREIVANRSLAAQRIRLEVQEALQNLEVAQASLVTAAKRVEAAVGAFRIAQKKRDLGQINQAEFIDVRRLLTASQLNRNVTRFETLGSLAELEYALGTRASHSSPEVPP